jgi:hypothetical protein
LYIKIAKEKPYLAQSFPLFCIVLNEIFALKFFGTINEIDPEKKLNISIFFYAVLCILILIYFGI